MFIFQYIKRKTISKVAFVEAYKDDALIVKKKEIAMVFIKECI